MNTHSRRFLRPAGTWSFVLALAVASLSSTLPAQQQGYYPRYSQQPYTGYGQTPAQGYQQPQTQNQYPPAYQQQPGYSYPQQGYGQQGNQYGANEYVTPWEFLPIFGRKLSETFRKLFYGDGNTTQSYGDYYSQQPQLPGHSLNQPPPGYSAQQPYSQQQPSYQPRYTYPPPSSSTTPRYTTPPAPKPSTPAPSKKSSTPKYSPPMPAPQTSTRVTEPKPKVFDSLSDNKPSNTFPLPGPAPEPPPEKFSPPPSPTPKTTNSSSSGSFLKGKKTNKAGRVVSPYPPYQELDVTGLSSGSLALDPTTQKVFEVP